MLSMRTIVVTALAGVTLAGCANINSVYRRPDLNDGRSMVIDAEQTAITNVRRGSGNIICARPAPDAIAADGGGFTFNGAFTTDQSIDMDGASGQGVAGIGLRTQSIQLLRDAMYRNCEALQNGGIDGFEFGIMQRRFQSNLIAILAVEQLTGAVEGPTAAVSAQSSASAGEEPSASTTVNSSATNAEARAQAAQSVAAAVQEITLTALGQDYSWQMCFEVLRLEYGQSALQTYCRALIEADADRRELVTAQVSRLAFAISDPDTEDARRADLIRALEILLEHGMPAEVSHSFTD